MATTRIRETPKSESRTRGLAARVSLGKAFAPVSVEFVVILSVALFLTVFGFVMVLSATSASTSPFDTALKQGVFAVVGVPLMLALSRVPVKFFRVMAWPALIGALAFQMLIYTPLGINNDGNIGWVDLGPVQAQPSEFLKLGTALWIGFILAKKAPLMHQFRHFAIPLIPVVLLVLASVMGGADMGTAMMIAMVVVAAMYFAGVKLRYLFLVIVVGVIGVIGFAVTSANRMRRITSFVDPDCTINTFGGICDQQVHALWALANGGLFGVGLGNSVEKYGWLPARGNDFIFAIVGEEFGVLGCVVVLVLFGLLLWAGLRVVGRTDDLFVRIVSGAITVWIVGQAMVNIAVVLRLAPALGVPLPFLSQGGTSLVSVLIACGVLLAFARSLPPVDPERPKPSIAHRGKPAVTRAR